MATSTFEEQQRHILALQNKSIALIARGASTANFDWEYRQAAAAALVANMSTSNMSSSNLNIVLPGTSTNKLVGGMSPRASQPGSADTGDDYAVAVETTLHICILYDLHSLLLLI